MLLISEHSGTNEEQVQSFRSNTRKTTIVTAAGLSILELVLMFGLFRTPAVYAAAPQKTQELRGQIVNEKNDSIAGVVCTLIGGMLPGDGITVTSSAKGEFSIRGLLPGSYALTCTALGYQPYVQTGLTVTEAAQPELKITMATQKKVVQQVQVQASAGSVAQQQASQPATLNSEELTTLPITEQKFKAALPLVPGVIRTPDGKINIKGSVENQGMLLIDGAEAVSPVTGGYDIDVSIDAIQSLNVYKAPFDPEYGGFSGGLTSIETKAPAAAWKWDFNDFFPSFRGRSGHLVGMNEWDPRLDFTGPIRKNNLTFSEALIYNVDKIPVRGLAWPHNETKKEGYNSLTEFQYVFSPQHIASWNLHIFPQKQEFANINSLLPQTASSNFSQRGYSGQGNDSYQFNSGGILSSFFKFTQFNDDAHGQGIENMLINPNGFGGNYFNSYKRSSSQEEANVTYRLPNRKWLGAHQLKAGGDFIYRTYSGTSSSRPVDLEAIDGTPVEQIDFLGRGGVFTTTSPATLSSDNVEGALFAGDHWMMSDRAALDLGLRYFGQSIGPTTSLAPRLGFVYTPDSRGNTIVRAGIGIFESRVPLLAGDFASNPTRVVTMFDSNGLPLGPAVTFQNVCARKVQQELQIVPSCSDLDTTPYNVTWTGEFDHQFGTHVAFRFTYLRSSTYRQFVINPVEQSVTAATLMLSNRGAARYHEFESMVSYRATNGTELNVSYVHSRTLGNLNTLSDVFVPFEEPVIRPDFYSSLAADVPDRMVTWGVFKLPYQIVFAPVVDWRTGFPYSPVDVSQNYVGPPNQSRFPPFFSFDFKVWKIFRMPGFLPFGLHGAKLRIGIGVRNATNALDPRDVYNNIASPFFGQFVSFQHRVIEIEADTGS